MKDRDLVNVFLDPIRKCADYKPAFGRSDSKGVTLADFQGFYGQDPFYNWLGLTDPAVYAAHKAAGGLTSLYRQIGVGSERLVRAALASAYALTPEQLSWSYKYAKSQTDTGVHTLDACVILDTLNERHRENFSAWLHRGLKSVTVGGRPAEPVVGCVMEVRQGYKSADSKRQNADIRFGMSAYQARLLPVFVVMSGQVSEPVIKRYRSNGMLVLTGLPSPSDTENTFAFFKSIVGYDLAGFFERNKSEIQGEITAVVKALLTPDA